MEKHIQQFRNILEPRKTESGIFKFMTRDWYPTKTFVLDRNYTPQDLKDITAKSLYIESLIEAESIRTGIRKEKLKQDVQQYLDEIGLEKKLYVIRWMGIVFLKLAFMMKIDIFVNETSISKLKSSLGKNPVLFLPTHRSYADFCLLTYLCYHYGIDFPAVAAGMDFYSMAVVGRSMRDTGAFYIRRTLAGAPLYAATLRHYVRTLVAKHSAPVEFFLEGTRSRSNKCLHPKYGMLSMTLLPLFSREVSDITIVPVNISYDKLIEHELFAYEHLGVPKPKESTGGLLRSIRRLNDNYGNIYINLGTPVSVKQFIKDSGNTDEILKPLDMQQVSPEQFKKVQDIADYVITLQQASTVVTVTNLLAIVVMESLMRNETLTLEEVGASVGLFGDLLRKLGANMFIEDVEASLRRVLVVHSRMLTIKDNRLRLLATPLMDVSPDITKKMKGHTLRADSMANAVPIIQLQMYMNPVLHYLVPAALLCATLQNGNSTIEQLRAPYSRVRALLRHEFFYIERNEQHTLDKAVEFCVENAVITNNGGYYTRGSNTSLQYTLSWTILPALATLSECIHVMREVSELPHKEALRRVQQRAELARLHPYCLSLEAAGNALHALLANGALNKLKSEDVVYQVVPQVMEECHLLVKSVLPAFSVDFDKSNSVILDQQVVSRL